jgi:hypothetical protein
MGKFEGWRGVNVYEGAIAKWIRKEEEEAEDERKQNGRKRVLPPIILPNPPVSPIGTVLYAMILEAEESGDADALRSVGGHHSRGRREANKGGQGSAQTGFLHPLARPPCGCSSSLFLGCILCKLRWPVMVVLDSGMTWGSRTQRLQSCLAASECTVTI